MMQSTPMASIVSTVSRSDSPFFTDDVATLKVMVSAESRLAAVSKLSRVRVESSKKSDTTVLPRRAGTRGMARSLTSTKESVTRRTSSIPAAPRSATERRCFIAAPDLRTGGMEPSKRRFCAASSRGSRGSASLGDHVADDDTLVAHVDLLVAAGGQVLADVVGTDGKLAVPPVHHDGQLDRLGPAVVGQRVEGGPHGAAGEEHVVD